MIVQQGGGIEIKEGEKGPSNLWTFATVWLPKYIWNIFGCVAHRKLKANCSFEDDELRGKRRGVLKINLHFLIYLFPVFMDSVQRAVASGN